MADISATHSKLVSYVESGKAEGCKSLLSSLEDKVKKTLLQTTDDEGFTLLHHAATREHHRVITVLLDSAAPSQTRPKTGALPDLHATLDSFDPTFLANMTDKKGRTPLHLAAHAGCVDCGMVRHTI
jgi:ankyrin repeat protein